MTTQKQKRLSAITIFLCVSTAAILLSLGVAVWVYRLKFGGVLSSDSEDWSSFGSYIGGLFGPLVSFVTLLAVLQTVHLQREFLNTQKNEFFEMLKLQRVQLRNAEIQSSYEELERYRSTTLQMLDRHILIYENKLARGTQGLQQLGQWVLDGHAKDREESAKSLAEMNDRFRRRIDGLIGLSIDLSQGEFKSIKEIRIYYSETMEKIFDGAILREAL